MTNEERELLLKDLCAKLPYGVKFAFGDNYINTIKGVDLIVTDEGVWDYAIKAKGIEAIEIEYIKPFLRPMSSMTKEENEAINKLVNSHKYGSCSRSGAITDYLNSIHIDYRGLIEKGLALEAPEDMYND